MRRGNAAPKARALVLGGGGITGMAWEVGVLVGLQDAGVDVSNADAVIGTSAGAYVGAAVASGHDLHALFDAQSEPATSEPAVAATAETWSAWGQAFTAGGDDPRRIGVGLAGVGRALGSRISETDREAVVRARLVTTEWPDSLAVTAIDADSGELQLFDAADGVALVDAVSASGAVPGIWPLVTFLGRS